MSFGHSKCAGLNVLQVNQTNQACACACACAFLRLDMSVRISPFVRHAWLPVSKSVCGFFVFWACHRLVGQTNKQTNKCAYVFPCSFTSQVDVSGNCSSEYKIVKARESETEIIKTRNLSNCTKRSHNDTKLNPVMYGVNSVSKFHVNFSKSAVTPFGFNET